MSSSSSATALGRSRSLRQPGTGTTLGTGAGAQKRRPPAAGGDDRQGLISSNNGNSSLNKGGSTSAPAPATTTDPRTNSPSRLPKFGSSSSTTTMTTATRTRAGTTGARSGIPSTSTTSTTGTRSRPNSGIFGLDRSNSLATRKPATQNDATEQAEQPARTVRPTTTSTRLARPKSISSAPKLSPTTSSRPLSLTTAASSTAKPQSPVTRSHSRTKSQATSLTSATTLRPPRPPSAGSIASTSTTTTTATTANKRPFGRSNTTTRPVRQEQPSASSSASTSVPNGSTASTTTAPTTTSSRAPKSTTAAATAAATATDEPPRLRPAFTSFQQHYSPARNIAPKPLTSTFLAPPSPSKLPANVALSSETARLQTELLQLHLLHRDADAAAASWHASARARLQTRFDALAAADQDVARDEAALEEARNLAALLAWAPDGGQDALEGRIQALDGVLSGLWSLGEPGGRYARVVRKFEKWFDAMVAAVEARRRAGGVGALTEGNEVAFLRELDPAWKEEVSYLARKLDGWRRQLNKLQIENNSSSSSMPDNTKKNNDGQEKNVSSGSSSSLARILAGCRAQTHDMLAELDLMEQIERDAISQEAAWIKRMNHDDDDDIDGADDTPRAGAIWRAF